MYIRYVMISIREYSIRYSIRMKFQIRPILTLYRYIVKSCAKATSASCGDHRLIIIDTIIALG